MDAAGLLRALLLMSAASALALHDAVRLFFANDDSIPAQEPSGIELPLYFYAALAHTAGQATVGPPAND